jgi:creatinine amidohydrolase
MPKPWLLGERTFKDLREDPPEVAVLPFGATEPHNYHLPYSTDTLQAETLAAAACERAFGKGAKCVALPPIPYGTETNQHRFPFAMNLQPSTLLAVLRDLVESLERTGVRKVLLLNGHGGNEFKGHLRELYGKSSVHLFLCDWFTVGKEHYAEVFEKPDDHAGEMETSVILHLRPDLVRMADAGDGATATLRFEACRQGWIKLTRPWHLLAPSSGSGDPRAATPEKGRVWFELVAGKIGDFLVELARSPLDESFPFASPGESR